MTDNVTVTVLNVCGITVVGPEELPAPVLVSTLRMRLRELHHRPSVVEVSLLQNGQELNDGDVLEGPEVELLVTYLIEPLTSLEREQCISRFKKCSFVSDVNETFQLLPERAKTDRDVALAAINKCGSLKDADETLRADKDVVLAAISKSGMALEYADPELQADEEIVLAAVKRCWSALAYAAPGMRANRLIAIAAAAGSADALDLVDDRLFDDRAFVEAMLETGGAAMDTALRRASPDLKDDELCVKAVMANGKALALLGAVAQNDERIAITAVRENLLALDYVGSELWSRKAFVLDVVALNGLSLEQASAALRDDKDVVLRAVKSSWRALRYASERLRGDRDIVTAATQKSSLAWELLASSAGNGL